MALAVPVVLAVPVALVPVLRVLAGSVALVALAAVLMAPAALVSVLRLLAAASAVRAAVAGPQVLAARAVMAG